MKSPTMASASLSSQPLTINWYVWGGGGAGGVARPCGIVGLYVVT